MRQITLLLFLTIVSFRPAQGQKVNLSQVQGNDVELSKKNRKALLEQLVTTIEENYYERAGTKKITDFVDSLSKSKEFKELDKSQAFSRYLTIALRQFTKDPHFNVLYSPGMFEQALRFQAAASSSQRRTGGAPGSDPDSRKNYFMPKAEVLEGNVGYLRLTQMPNIRNARPTVDAAMAFLGNADALIIDVRGNGGGIGGFTPYLASYFFGEGGKLLFSREMPAYDSITHFYSEKELPSPRFVDKPLYVLIDRFTGSAARNLAYTLQKHGRAQLVGEETGVGSAGGHSAGLFPLSEGYVATVPIANVVHPVSKSNWSMVGVVPDFESTSEDALVMGHLVALENLLEEADGPIETELSTVLNRLKNEDDEVEETTTSDFNPEDYVGQYDVRKVFVKDQKLYFQREGQPELEMKKEGEDLFSFMLPAGMRANALPRALFKRNAQGVVISITFLDENDKVLSSYERK